MSAAKKPGQKRRGGRYNKAREFQAIVIFIRVIMLETANPPRHPQRNLKDMVNFCWTGILGFLLRPDFPFYILEFLRQFAFGG